MNLTDEQEEALNSVQSAFGDAESFADALNDEAQSFHQEIFNRGHSTATSQKKDDIQDLQGKVADLEEQVSTKEEQIEQLKEDQPDIDEAIESVREEEVRPLKEKHQQLKERLTTQAKREGRQAVKQRLMDQGLDEWTADAALERHLNGHVDVGDDFEPRFLQDPQNEVPVSADDEEAPAVLADRILDAVPDKYKPDTEQGGPRSTSGKNRSGENGTVETDGLTKSEVLSSDQKTAEFFGQFDNADDAQEALNQLPDE